MASVRLMADHWWTGPPAAHSGPGRHLTPVGGHPFPRALANPMIGARPPVIVRTEPSLLPVYRQVRTALDAFVLGDAGPYQSLWAHTEDVSILGAFGGRNLGWIEVRSRLEFTANQYRSGRYDDVEVLASVAGSDLGHIVWLDTISVTSAGGEAAIHRRPVTHVFRREGESWRIVRYHADPLVDLVSPS